MGVSFVTFTRIREPCLTRSVGPGIEPLHASISKRAVTDPLGDLAHSQIERAAGLDINDARHFGGRSCRVCFDLACHRDLLDDGIERRRKRSTRSLSGAVRRLSDRRAADSRSTRRRLGTAASSSAATNEGPMSLLHISCPTCDQPDTVDTNAEILHVDPSGLGRYVFACAACGTVASHAVAEPSAARDAERRRGCAKDLQRPPGVRAVASGKSREQPLPEVRRWLGGVGEIGTHD